MITGGGEIVVMLHLRMFFFHGKLKDFIFTRDQKMQCIIYFSV